MLLEQACEFYGGNVQFPADLFYCDMRSGFYFKYPDGVGDKRVADIGY